VLEHWATNDLEACVRFIKHLTAAVITAATLMAGQASASSRHARIIHNLLCIHHYEGAWNDHGAPYWGGLQMDMNFQRAYGRRFLRRWGTADHWPVWAQLEAGVRAVLVRGYEPWPTSGRMCGLL
jgi:hypothetical protein